LPPLTTIRQDFPRVGKLGVQCLLEEIRSGSRGTRTYTIVPTLIQRASTARPRKKSQRPARSKNGDVNHR
jgi:DNA-binding LacI/PurR family transcriptional regulator